MARPQKLGLSYFPFDSDFLSKLDIMLLYDEYGGLGIFYYVCIICEIYKENGYYLQLDDKRIKIICKILSVRKDEFIEITEFCASLGLFDIGLWDNKMILTSEEIQATYQKAKDRAGRLTPIKVNPDIWLLDEDRTLSYIIVDKKDNSCVNNELFCVNNDDFCVNNAQSKVKENKVNYIKTKPKAVSLFEKSFGGVGAEEEAMLIMYADKGVPDSMFEYAIAESEKRGRGIKYALGVIANRVNNNRLDIKKKSDASYDLEEFESKMWEVPEI